MKLTESRIKEIILEEIQAFAEEEKAEKLGSVRTSSSERAKGLRKGAANVSKEQGIDPKEYGIMQQFEALLKELSNLTDIKTGKTMTILNPMFKKLDAIRNQLRKQEQEKK
jgi:hypothetical protein